MSDPSMSPEQIFSDDPVARGENQQLGAPGAMPGGPLHQSLQHIALAPADALQQPWIPLGPRNVGGRISSLAIDPVNPLVLYAGSALGGAWKTEDGGDTWRCLESLPFSLPVGAIAVAPLHPHVVYIGTGDPDSIYGDTVAGFGLFRSSDWGNSLTLVAPAAEGTPATPTAGALSYSAIQVDPQDPDRYWVAGLTGLWRHEPDGSAEGTFIHENVLTLADEAKNAIDATDVAINTQDPERIRVYAGLRGEAKPAKNAFSPVAGLYRGTYERSTKTTTWEKLTLPLPEGSPPRRVKVALCAAKPNFVYAVVELKTSTTDKASRVFRSSDGGDSWSPCQDTGDSSHIAFYALMLSVHPTNPDILFTGTLEVYRSTDAGLHWTKVLDWLKFDRGDRAQHADQHVLVFDPTDPTTVWLGNDGGISLSRNLGKTWRKRSDGILAAQFNDITMHPLYPNLMAGGLQDNGTWLSYGGPTWYHVGGGDGGHVGFHPTDPRDFFLTYFPGTDTSSIPFGIQRCQIEPPTSNLQAFTQYSNATPDLEDMPSDTRMVAHQRALTDPGLVHAGLFVGIIEHHPTQPNHLLVARQGAVYLWNGSYTAQNIPNIVNAVTAVAYHPTNPNLEWWAADAAGVVCRTVNAGGAWTRLNLPGAPTQRVTRITFHPAQPNRVAVAFDGSVSSVTPYNPGVIFFSDDGGLTWFDISGRATPPPGSSSVVDPSVSRSLPPCGVTALTFDRTQPDVLYAGTAVGVYVCRNVNRSTPLWDIQWKVFSEGLPRCFVSDLALVPLQDRLRAATYGRGIYEVSIHADPTPAVMLYIRNHLMDDGTPEPPVPNRIPTDPRFPVADAPPLDMLHSFDIRVSVPPFPFFDQQVDGVEFDEQLPHQHPVVGEVNRVYVQVHNRGYLEAYGVQVSLYFASAGSSTPQVPALQDGFWEGFPTPPGGAWTRIGKPQSLKVVASGQPSVARFEWIPPVDLDEHVALLAICTHAKDDLTQVPPESPLTSDVMALVEADRRVALRLTRVAGDVYIRRGLNDNGARCATPWGAKSPDILITSEVLDSPDITYQDLGALPPNTPIPGNTLHSVRVRVHNSHSVEVDATVELFAVPGASLTNKSTWRSLGRFGVPHIPAQGWKLTQAIPWHPMNLDPAVIDRSMVLIAALERAHDPMPDVIAQTPITLDDLRSASLIHAQANNLALRAVRLQDGPTLSLSLKWDQPTTRAGEKRTLLLVSPSLNAGQQVTFTLNLEGFGANPIHTQNVVAQKGYAELVWDTWFAPEWPGPPLALVKGQAFPDVKFSATAQVDGVAVPVPAPQVLYQDTLTLQVKRADKTPVVTDYTLFTSWGHRTGQTDETGKIVETGLPPGGATLVLSDGTFL